ncbi:hypothetical protein [Microbacterium memoriense]|uniref:Acyltransferase 3 domain-containing protein n=1 Tax=Microbacterium memoriense TaxID=2978350 RepID=A0ABT2PB37_9MICO|nr:hypothetical protein [Microbacterium memoriense]MCT9001821.1 hypothetical protein [Microbacterium memoriense]
MAWMDATRGLALFGVLILHADLFAYRENVAGNPLAFWTTINIATWPFLLAPLFMISGMLRPDPLSRRASDARTWRSVGILMWIYAV